MKTVELPKSFVHKMTGLLKEEIDDFLSSYTYPSAKGLRINTLKQVPIDLLRAKFQLESVFWCDTGYYYNAETTPGKSPFHQAGAYYIQEPSAMAVAEFLRPIAGSTVLDLCAAPGGKSTHLAAFLSSEGVLVANEPYPKRCATLVENLERMGVRNAIVTQNDPQELAKVFGEWFDYVLVDAPCSGEGMFRKDLDSIAEWSVDRVELNRQRQLEILSHASSMLKHQGRLIYSTCTFSPEENEQLIADFLHQNGNFELVPISAMITSPGRPEWANPPVAELSGAVRIWPHLQKGEGHFMALLQKNASSTSPASISPKSRSRFEELKRSEKAWLEDWLSENLIQPAPEGGLLDPTWQARNERRWIVRNEHVYLGFANLPSSIHHLRVVRPGLWIGQLKRQRFEPSHSLACALWPEEAQHAFQLSDLREDAVHRYLKGETLERKGLPGWVLVLYEGLSLGWGKQSGGMLKNHFPKGLRW